MKFKIILSILLLFGVCLAADPPEPFNYRFSENSEGWEGIYSDYPVGVARFYELSWGWTSLPDEQMGSGKGLIISGHNYSDDLFMGFKTQIDGLEPGRTYLVMAQLILATNAPTGSIGIGGSPGEGVHVKIGASTNEPLAMDIEGFWQLNVDKGNQAEGGTQAVVVGNLANPLVDPKAPTFQLKELETGDQELYVTADKDGKVWVFFGTDSGFEGLTTYYAVELLIQLTSAQSP